MHVIHLHMDIRDRIKLMIETEGVTQAAFAESTGINTSTLNHVLTGRNNPSMEVITKILSTYPQYESDWLIHGDGSMWTEAYSEERARSSTIPLFQGVTAATNFAARPTPELQSGSEKASTEKRSLSSLGPFAKVSVKRVQRVIIYYDDNTYETLYPSRSSDLPTDPQ